MAETGPAQRVAEALLAAYATEYDADHLTWLDFKADAERYVGVVAGFLRERAALIPPPSDDEPFALGFNAAIQALGAAAQTTGRTER